MIFFFNEFPCFEIKVEFDCTNNTHTHNQMLNSLGLGIIRAGCIYFCISMLFFPDVICIVVCLLHIFSHRLCFLKPWRLFHLGQMVCISLLFFSFQCFYPLCN